MVAERGTAAVVPWHAHTHAQASSQCWWPQEGKSPSLCLAAGTQLRGERGSFAARSLHQPWARS